MDNQHPPKLGKCEACDKEYITAEYQSDENPYFCDYYPTPNCPYCGYSQLLYPDIFKILQYHLKIVVNLPYRNVISMVPLFTINSKHITKMMMELLKEKCPKLDCKITEDILMYAIERSCRVEIPGGRVDYEHMTKAVLRAIQNSCVKK
jgi:hypothetical protein